MPPSLAARNEQFLANSPEEFVQKVLPYAQEVGEKLGVAPETLIAQAALETGWGKHAPKNNLFGIKAGSNYKGPSTNADTTEYRNGVAGTERADFRGYGSLADSFKDLGGLISGNKRYEGAMGAGNDAGAYATGLLTGGYATDPDYKNKLVSVAQKVGSLTSAESSEDWDAASLPETSADWDAASMPETSEDWDAASMPALPQAAAPPSAQPVAAAPQPAAAPTEEPSLFSSMFRSAFRSTPQDLRRVLSPVIDPVMSGFYDARQGSNPLTIATGIEDTRSGAKDIVENELAKNAIPTPSYVTDTEKRAREAAAKYARPEGEQSGFENVMDWMIGQADKPANKLSMTGALAAPILRGIKEHTPSVAGLAATGEYIKDPRAALHLALESLASSGTSLGLGAVGGLAGGSATGGPLGAVVGGGVGAGTGSFLTEYGSDIINTFREAKVDLTNEDAIVAAFSNKELMAKARTHALKRGASVALFDAISAGIAGKVAKPVERIFEKAGIKHGGKLAGEVAEMVTEGESGAAGESLAQKVNKDKEDATAIAGERVGEYGPGAIEIVMQRALGVRASKLKALREKQNKLTEEELTKAQAEIDAETLDAIDTAGAESKNAPPPPPPPGTMPTPGATGSPTPDVEAATVTAPIPATAQEAATTQAAPTADTTTAPAPIPDATTQASPTDTKPSSVAADAAPQKTEVPPAQAEPQVSTPAPTPHVDPVTQPGEVQAGGTTAPASQTPVSKRETAPTPTPEKEITAAPATEVTAPEQAREPARFAEADDEIEDVRKMFGLPPPPPKPELGQQRKKDVAVQVFNQINSTNPDSKKLLEKRLATLPTEARQKIETWQAARAKVTKELNERIANNKAGLQRFADSAGWDNRGGRLIVVPGKGDTGGAATKVVGAEPWLPKAPWFKEVQGNTTINPESKIKRPMNERADLPGNNEGKATREAVRKALAGEPLSTQEKRHLNGMLRELDNERAEAAKMGIHDYDPYAANEAVAKTAPAEETDVRAARTALVHRAMEIDEAATNRVLDESDDDASLWAGIQGIIDRHGQANERTLQAGSEAVRPTEGGSEDAQSADDFFKEQIAASAAKAAAPKVAAAQGELLPDKNQTKQDLADYERKKDEKRSPNKDVPADTGGGLFSQENKQTNIEEGAATYDNAPTDDEQVTELDDDIGANAAQDGYNPDEADSMDEQMGMGPEASMSEENAEASSRDKKRRDTSKPSTARENLMEWLGIDPAKFRRMGGAEQFATARKAIMERYGFRSITKHPSQNWRNANDHLLDAFEGLQNMAAVLGASPKVASLFGKLALHLQRNTKARGLFYPTANLISIMDQSDVFAHEFGHAIDYNLMEEGGGMMTPGGLSAAIRKREGTAMLPDTVADAYVDLMTALYYDAAHIAQEIKQAEHQLEKAKTDKQRAQLQTRLDNLRSGAWRGHSGKTQFYQRAKNGPMKAYMTKPTELVARSFEAYISYKIEQMKSLGFTGFIGSTDAMYRDESDAWMKRAYPQATERAQIFAAWDAVIGQLTREGIYDTSQPVGIAESKVNLGLMDPVAQAKMAGLPLTPEIVKAKNLSDKAAKSWHKDEVQRRDTIRNNLRTLTKALKEGTPNALKELNSLMRSFASTPDGVFAYLENNFPNNSALRDIRNLFSDAQIYGRNKPQGLYRAVQQREAALVEDVIKRLSVTGIIPNMPQEWTDRMWDIIHGLKEPANEEEKIQADRIRYEYERLFKLRDKHAVSLGYTDEEYQNRITARDVADNPRFGQDVIKLRKAEQKELLKQYAQQLKDAKTDEETKAIEDKIKKTQAINVVKQTNDQIAKMKGLAWRGPPILGAMNEDSAKSRVFGPLADEILKEWYIKDPVDLLSTYAASAAREMIYSERLGENPNEAIDEMLVSASTQGLPSAYAGLLTEAMHISLGINTSGSPLPGSPILSAYASVSQGHLMGRAVLPNVSEPLAAISRSIKPGDAIAAIFKASLSKLMSQPRKRRYAAADQFGRISGTLVDASRAITAQAQVTGDSTQGKGLVAKYSQKAYWFNLLTPLTSIQERVMHRMASELFHDAAASIRAKDSHAELSAQWLREHGIKNAEAFADFMADPNIMEKLTLEDTFTGQGRELAQGLNQYVKTTVQSPTPSTKLMIASKGNFGFIARLTSWMSTNFRNWTIYNKDKIKSAFTGKYGDAHLTAKQRVTAAALPVGAAMMTMYISQAFFVAARMMLTNSDDWEERGDDFWDRFWSKKTQMQIMQYWGLLGWLSNVLIDLTVGARTRRGIFATIAGPVYGPLVQDMERFIMYAADQFSDSRDDNNTAERNASMASYHLMSMMASLLIVSMLPQSKAGGVTTGFLWSFFGTSPQAANWYANWMSGRKKGDIDTSTAMGRVEKAEQKMDKAEAEENKKDKAADKQFDRQFNFNGR